RTLRKKKVAMFMCYSGKGYFGMQRNPGYATIERDLIDALAKAGVVTQDQAESPGPKMQFQRAARTDKGVSAAGQVCSLKISVFKINEHLPEQIRILGIIPVTKGFDSKNSCNGRTYTYMVPTYAFTPVEMAIQRQVNIILSSFVGTHNFHNYTSGKKPTDPSAHRYIISFKMGDAFIVDGIEFAVITIRGQSFMLHQIRKMIGVTIAIMRGYSSKSVLIDAWGQDKCDIPRAPGLGLMLDKVHYDDYNKYYGNDGIHTKLDWEVYKDTVEDFKKKHIYSTVVEGEKNDKSMMTWISTLLLHKF
ncbi:hypothetical protein CAPTEDRAFT_83969, partial [Capitella teleta]